MKLVLCTFLLIALIWISQAATGVDLSQRFSKTTFECIKKSGHSLAVVRGFQSFGAVDPNAVTNLKEAKEAGLTTDIYMFPCVGKSASSQASALAAGISSSLYGKVWVDVEKNPSSGCGWKSASENCAFLESLVSSLKSHGLHVGVYASSYQWETIFGSKSACAKFTGEPLWYAHYDNKASFSDFTAFGGWSKPHMKQYKGDTTLCGAGVDLNYYA